MNPEFSLERLLSALACIPADDRDMWLHVGMALKAELGDDGFRHFDAWSENAENYNARATASVWRSFRGAGKITAGTLYHYAKLHGWQSDLPPDPDRVERRKLHAERAAVDAAMLAKDRAQAVHFAKELWFQAHDPLDHPYLLRKQLRSMPTVRELTASTVASILGYQPKSGDRVLEGRLLIVPVKIAGALSTVELIDVAGHKSALRGGAKKAGYWATGPQEGTILIAEGMATAATVSMALAAPGVAALSCGNLLPVAEYMRIRFPTARLVICADIGNGQAHAEKASLAVGGCLAVPDFGKSRPHDATDFNDLFCMDGLDIVREQLRDVL
jgi:putative DNA primase/helicase